jgi:hypothetical protein
MSFDTMTRMLSSAVANGGTFTVGYLDGRSAGSYTLGRFHKVNGTATGELTQEAGQVSFSFGASEITITNNTGQSIPAGSTLWIQCDRLGIDNPRVKLTNPGKMGAMNTIVLSLGAPVALDADGIVASQAATSASGLATGINGALASDGACTLDVPRNVVAAWTNTAVLTVTGTDEYGVTIREASASGTSLTGKKAFKTVTGISVSADVTGLTVGTAKVLGLPVFLPAAGLVLAELQNGAVPTAGTTVAGDLTKATALTGDVRGTYAPNTNPNGSNSLQLVVAVDDADFRGVPQF